MAARRTTRTTRTTVTVESGRGVFMISVAAELAEMHPQTLRMYEQRGLISPKRSPKGTRLYSQEDVDRLRRIQEMTTELGLNLAGVERVLALEEQLAGAQRQLDQLEEELELARRTLRGELVPVSRTSTAIIRASDIR
jgi:MerR family transcriptional regulator/heat shock protein HspR